MRLAYCRAMSHRRWQQLRRMIGEFLREAGILVAVLAPLELFVTHGSLTLRAVIGIVVVAGPCLLAGLALGLED